MLLVLLSAASAAPVCPATVAELNAALDEAEAAFVKLDAVGLRAGWMDAAAEVGCLQVSIPPVVAARLHRAGALRAFVDGDEAAARRSMLAARVLDPSGTFPAALLPADHPLRALDPGAGPHVAATIAVRPPPVGTLSFDGQASLYRPSDRPTAMQVLGPDGATVQGAYLWPEEPLGPWTSEDPRRAGAERAPPRDPPAAEARSGGRLTRPLAITSAVSLVLAGAAYTVSELSYRSVLDEVEADPSVSRETTDPALRRHQRFFPMAVGLGGVGALTGLGAVATWVW